MAVDLRVLIADAYRAAALAGADMPVSTRALEAVRAAASQAGDAAFAALDEVYRQAGRTNETALAPVLMDFGHAIEAARAAEDMEAIRQTLARDAARGWVEFRCRFARALAEFKGDVVDGIAEADLPLAPEQKAIVGRWIEQMRFARRDKWDRALDLFESLGRDDVVGAADRGRFLARATQIHIYYTRDRDAADAALAEARSLTSLPGTPPTARAEVLSAAGQVEVHGGRRDAGMRLYLEAIEVDPHFEDPYKWLGDAIVEAAGAGDRELDEAEKWYDRGIENAPGGTLNVTALARILGRPERYRTRRLRVAELRQHALRVTRPKDRYGLYTTFADIALQNDEIEEATRLSEVAIAEDGTRPDARVLLARIRNRTGDPIAAIAEYGRAWQADSESFDSWREAGDVVAAAANPAAASTLLDAVNAAFAAAPAGRLASLRIRLLQENGEWDEAEAESQRAFSADGDEAAHHRRLALIRNAYGNRSFESSDYVQAEDGYRRALEATPEDAVLWGNLALALENQTGGDVVERLGRALHALGLAIEKGVPGPDPEYITRRDVLSARYRLASRYGPETLDYPVVPQPIGLDVGPGLLEEVVVPGTDRLSQGCLDMVERVRRRLADEIGVTLPGISFRDWTAATGSGDYLTLVGGLAVTQESVPSDRRLLLGAAPPPGVPPDLPPAADPLSGRIGFWVPESALDRVEGEHEAWTPLEYAIHDLARVYLRNVRTELTPDDVARSLESAGVPDAAAIAGDPVLLLRVTRVVRALVAERAPVTALESIAALVREAGSAMPVTWLVERARVLPGVREKLPGNDGSTAVLELGPQLSALVREAIWHHDEEPALAILPDDCQELLARVRALPGRLEDQVLVTEPELRPFVRWVLELEFPGLPVLSRRELTTTRTPEAVVDLEPAFAEAAR